MREGREEIENNDRYIYINLPLDIFDRYIHFPEFILD